MPGRTTRPAAFLDRDGTILVEKDYLADPRGVELIPGAAEALARLRGCGFMLVMVSNQSGIARGLFTMADFEAVQERVEAELDRFGVRLDAVFVCPHHPDFTGPCACRKPGLALFLEAAETLGLELSRSVWIGDRVDDIEPALRFGGRGWLVRTGYGGAQAGALPGGLTTVDDLTAAAAAICEG